jgi:DNA-binding MarR family transcriptional regulator
VHNEVNGQSPLVDLVHSLRSLEHHLIKSIALLPDVGALDNEIRLRRERNRLFPSGYFADAAWEILLDLYKAHVEQRECCITDLGLGGGIPQTTMLRYLDKLHADGFIARHPDPRDRRRVFIALTEVGVAKMASLFGSKPNDADEPSNIHRLPVADLTRAVG